MNLKTIIAIAGKPGLFKVVAQGNQSIIVESLIDKKRMAAHASNKISALEDISIYTDSEDVLMSEVYHKIFEKENGGACISHKASESELRAYLAEVLPNYDRDRVYISDIKKLFNWYNMLHAAEMLILMDEETEAESAEDDAPKKEKKAKVAAPSKVAAPKSAAPKTNTASSKAPAKKPTVQRKSS
jgi:hypothetical protein